MNFTFRNILAVSYLILMAILPVTEAGFGTGPGTDPYGFGDVSETCKSIFATKSFNPTWARQIYIDFSSHSVHNLLLILSLNK